MPPFPRPAFSYNYQVQAQINALRDYRDTAPGRAIPQKAANRLLLATWNIANLGLQARRDRDYRLLAELIGWFDLVAVQEVHDNLSGLRAILGHLPASYRVVFSDVAGNSERLAYVFDANKVALLEKVGEIAIPPSSQRYIRLPITTQTFRGFDRNPYIAGFRAGNLTLVLANVHLYFGSDSTRNRNRRSLETYAVGRWADLRRRSQNAFTPNIIALGDFNLPRTQPGDPVYDALTRRGLRVPAHSSVIASAIATDNQYDQIAFFPGPVAVAATGNRGIFDFDGGIFASLWNNPNRSRADFLAYLRYYISDHRIMWSEFAI